MAQGRFLVVKPKHAPILEVKMYLFDLYIPLPLQTYACHPSHLTLPRTSTGSLELRSTGLTLSPVSMLPTGERLSKMASNFTFSSGYTTRVTHKHTYTMSIKLQNESLMSFISISSASNDKVKYSILTVGDF